MAKSEDIDDYGKEWASSLVKRIGTHAKTLRGSNSAQWLSDRTAEAGMRISPSVIARLDSGHRGDVLSVPELFVIAAALNVAPLDLLAAGAPDGETAWLPGKQATVAELLDWFTGDAPPPDTPTIAFLRPTDQPHGRAGAITSATRRLTATMRELQSVAREASSPASATSATTAMLTNYVGTLRERARDLRTSLRAFGADVRDGEDNG